MRTELTFEELDSQQVALLPAKETLDTWSYSVANLVASNTSLAFNVGSYQSYATSGASQSISIAQ